MTLGERMKQRRKELGLTQDDLALSAGTIKQTIYKYESGKVENIPRAKLEAIAAALKLSPAQLLGFEQAAPLPSAAEAELLELAARLNAAGQRELLRYGGYLAGLAEYAAAPKVISIESARKIRHYLVSAAAGFASPVEGEDYEMIEAGEAPAQADFCIDVSGDSMEPFIGDGERVYVQSGARLENFDVGVFFYDGDVFIKQLYRDGEGGVHLLSANSARTDANKYISPDAGASLVCFGKALLPRRLPKPAYFRA